MVESSHPDLEAVRRAAQAERARRASQPRTVADVSRPPVPNGEQLQIPGERSAAPLLGRLFAGKAGLIAISFAIGVSIGAIAFDEGQKVRSLTEEKHAIEQRLAEFKTNGEQASADVARREQDVVREREKLATERRKLDGEKSEFAKQQAELVRQRDELSRQQAANPAARPTRSFAESDAFADALGFRVAELTGDLRVQWGIGDAVQGLLITQSDTRSVGYRAGFRPGVILLQIGRMPVQTVSQFELAARALLQRGGEVSFLIKIGPNPPVWRLFEF